MSVSTSSAPTQITKLIARTSQRLLETSPSRASRAAIDATSAAPAVAVIGWPSASPGTAIP